MWSRRNMNTSADVAFCESGGCICDPACRLDMVENQRRMIEAQAWAMGALTR
jgi:hypothetical protein